MVLISSRAVWILLSLNALGSEKVARRRRRRERGGQDRVDESNNSSSRSECCCRICDRKAGVNIKEISSKSGANLKFANKNDMIGDLQW